MLKHIYGHRGARGLYPENTMFGFKQCLKNNLKGIEFDVVVSKDKDLIVSHEPWMNYLFCAKQGINITKKNQKSFNLYTMTFDEIKTFDVGSKQHLFYPHQTLQKDNKPKLITVFNWLNSSNLTHLTLLIEIKSFKEWYNKFQPLPKEYAKIIVDFFNNNALKYHNIIIKSFDIELLNEIHKLGCLHPLGVLIDNKKTVKNNLNQLNFKPISYNLEYKLITKTIVSELKQLNIKCTPWTVNSIKDAIKLESMGVESIITDYPNLFTVKVNYTI